ncbi:MAG: hypothetical protein F4056_08890 [Chloroflexi bacterium]|nr:hypothetical protein [Chloroflexota bacterium]
MARVQLIIPDEDRDRFFSQAKREGLTLSAWLRAAAHECLKSRQQVKHFESPEELEAFFRESNAKAGPGREPDWEEHLATMSESRLRGTVDA